MISASACLSSQPDTAVQSASEFHSYTTRWGRIPLPLGLRLFLQSVWADEPARSPKSRTAHAQTKPEIALADIGGVIVPECASVACLPMPTAGSAFASGALRGKRQRLLNQRFPRAIQTSWARRSLPVSEIAPASHRSAITRLSGGRA